MRGGSASSKRNPEMDSHTGKFKKRNLDFLRGASFLVGLIHGDGHSSEQCKILSDFVNRYDTGRTPDEKIGGRKLILWYIIQSIKYCREI